MRIVSAEGWGQCLHRHLFVRVRLTNGAENEIIKKEKLEGKK